jgi:hypothetical protein
VLQYLPRCFDVPGQLGIVPPVVVALTLTGVKGFTIARGFGRNEIDRDILVPEEMVESYDRSPGAILKPLFDMIWNACGLPRSENFDENGQWIVQ